MKESRNCPHCGKDVGGATETCPHCRGSLDVASSASADENKCPKCGSQLRPDDVICIQCGTNLLTGTPVLQRGGKAARPRAGKVIAVIVACAVAAGAVGWAIWYLRHDYAADGRRKFLEGSLEESAESYNKALRRNERDATVLYESGLVELSRRQYTTAAERFARVMELEPANARAQLLLGVSYALQGNTNSELVELERAVSMDPENSLAHFVLGLAYTKLERREKGVEELERAVELDPYKAEYHRLLGSAYIGVRKYDEAIEQLQKALNLGPGNAETQMLAGALHGIHGKQDDAVALLRGAASSGSAYDARVQYHLGAAYVLSGRYGDAVRELNEALRLQPGNPTVHLALGFTYSIEGRMQEALYEFEQVANAAVPQMAKANAYAESGRIRIELGDTTQAEDLYNKALAAEPNSYMAHVGLGYLYSRQERSAEAVREFRKAIDLSPDAGAAHLFLAIHYAGRKDFGEAARALEKFAQLSPDLEESEVVGVLAQQLRYSASL